MASPRIGALPFKMDEWGVDVAITGSQKALMLPPGLAFVAFSDRAWAAVEKNKGLREFYLDLKAYTQEHRRRRHALTPRPTR